MCCGMFAKLGTDRVAHAVPLEPQAATRLFTHEQEQEKKSRLRGLEAHKANIVAAKSVARLMRSSMGPKGMDKMMQSPDGDILISEISSLPPRSGQR